MRLLLKTITQCVYWDVGSNSTKMRSHFFILLIICVPGHAQLCRTTSNEVYISAIEQLVLKNSDTFKKARSDNIPIIFRQEGLGIPENLKIILPDDTIDARVINDQEIRLLMTKAKSTSKWFTDITPLCIDGLEMTFSFRNGIYLTNRKLLYSHTDKITLNKYRLNTRLTCWEEVQ